MKKLVSVLIALALVLTMCPFAFGEAAYSESPMLTAKVEAGELPPLAERLPSNPQVLVNPEPGIYRGTWRQATVSGTYSHAQSHLTRYLDINALIYDRDRKTVICNWLEDFQYNEAFTEFTFKLREGLKWSDGDPVTTEDVAFWYNDILKNTELSPTDSYYYDCTFTVVDDYTWMFVFEAGKPLYLTRWAWAGGWQIVKSSATKS